MSLIEAGGGTAVVRKWSASSRIPASKIVLSLGLIDCSPRHSAPKFKNTDVMELYTSIGVEVESLTTCKWRTIDELRRDSQKEGSLSTQVRTLAARFGEKIWGRKNRSHLLIPGSNRLYPKSLVWSCEEDRNTIKFYI